MKATSQVPPITMSLMGGLGNQLFQFATGLQIARLAGTQLVLDIAWFTQRLRRDNGLVLRPFELRDVARGIEILPPPRAGVASNSRHARDVLLRRLPFLAVGPLSRFVVESRSDFDPQILMAPPGAHLSGYFASWRYFTDVSDEVRSRVNSSVVDTEWVSERVEASRKDGAIALHVRRGDYLALGSIYGHVTPAYYARAVRVLRRLGHNGPIWLFSDEPREALEWIRADVDVDVVVESSPRAQSIDTLSVMSSAAALVIANSTFSWWAAFLNDSDSRTVIAPRPAWGAESLREPRDNLLPSWLTLDCRDFRSTI